MDAFSWNMLRGTVGIQTVMFILVDTLVIRRDVKDGRKHTELWIKDSADEARDSLLGMTEQLESYGFQYTGTVYTAEVPKALVPDVQHFLLFGDKSFPVDFLIHELKSRWERV